MRGIDQHVDTLGGEMIGEAAGAAEAADAKRHRVGNRRGGAAGERQCHVEIGALRQPLRQQPRFSRAAENEDFRHAAS